jgi:lysophospholipase L1-like esterase
MRKRVFFMKRFKSYFFIAFFILSLSIIAFSIFKNLQKKLPVWNAPEKKVFIKSPKKYFFNAFLVFSLSIGTFYAFKTLLPKRLFTEIAVHSDNIAIDSITIPDTLSTVEKDSTISEVQNDIQPLQSLENFFKKLFALEKTKKNIVRIAYFGDSIKERDMIAHDFRKSYQKKYGGSGRGFAMLSNVNELWGLSRYDFSPEWVTHTFLKKVQPVPVGVSGYVSVAKNDAPVWTHFRYRAGAPPLTRSELFYGKSNNDSAKVTVISNKDTSFITNLETNNILNKQPLTSSTSEELILRFNDASEIPFYGVNFTDGDGVYIDNFFMRSSAGAPLSTLDEELMNAFHQELQYDLIILQFGLNIINSEVTKYNWYANKMENTVTHLKKCFPGADILVISLHDQAKKYETEMRTNDALPDILRAQKRYAKNSGAGFINLFQLMGGTGSMIKWVNEGMANADYTHFNYKGAKKAAELIFKQIESEYEEYKKENNLFEDYE